MMASPDVIIVGAGISGCSAAYNLAALGLKVEIIEKHKPASMASGWTLAGVRQSGRENSEIPLAKFSVDIWPHLNEILGYKTGYTQKGNLRLARTEKEVQIITSLVKEQKKLGLDIEYLPSRNEIIKFVPNISENILAASFCKTDGHADPISTVNAYKMASENLNAQYNCDEEVKNIIVKNGTFKAVITDKRLISGGACILANGIHINSLIQQHGLSVPLQIPIVTVVQTEPTEISLTPVLGVANANLAMRKENNGRIRFTSGLNKWEGRIKYISNKPYVHPSIESFSNTIEIAASVLPDLKTCNIKNLWGGLIDLTPDSLPIIDQAPGIEGLLIASGFSGHGFGIAPAVGEILRDMAIGIKPKLPIDAFNYNRFQNYSTNEFDKNESTLYG